MKKYKKNIDTGLKPIKYRKGSDLSISDMDKKKEYGINIQHRAKKSMGQNFLKSQSALNKMCEAGEVKNTDIVVEIGPGKGALTEKLLEKALKVIAVEKDRDLIDILTEKFKKEIKSGKLLVLNEDIMFFNPNKQGLYEGGYKIIANIPYNITGSIIRKFLSEVERPNTMTILVQYEVAKRICVNTTSLNIKGLIPTPGVEISEKESILSLSVKAYGTPKYIMKVNKRFFSPSPKVDSAIISINNISNKFFKDKNNENSFFTLMKAGFAHKRKVLRKNLEEIEGGVEIIDKIFNELNINPKTRAEDISFDKWLSISEKLG